jgi:hypothetical protein
MSQKTTFFIFTAVKTSNLIKISWFSVGLWQWSGRYIGRSSQGPLARYSTVSNSAIDTAGEDPSFTLALENNDWNRSSFWQVMSVLNKRQTIYNVQHNVHLTFHYVNHNLYEQTWYCDGLARQQADTHANDATLTLSGRFTVC